jgi:hypothetical protein
MLYNNKFLIILGSVNRQNHTSDHPVQRIIVMDFVHIVQLNKIQEWYNALNKTKMKLTCLVRSIFETHARVMKHIDRNSESKFEHADCNYDKYNSGYTYDIFNTGHYYGNFENGTLQTILERFRIWKKVTRGSHKKSPIMSLHSFFLLWQ